MKYAIAVLVTLGLAPLAWVLDVPRQFGAHPWWSQQVLMTGALLGLAIGLVAHWALKGRLATLVMLIIATGLGFAVAKYGQTQFAASYAEDAFAGRLWFFGWHATTVMSFATITAASLFRPK